jgi:hypothetical protein
MIFDFLEKKIGMLKKNESRPEAGRIKITAFMVILIRPGSPALLIKLF